VAWFRGCLVGLGVEIGWWGWVYGLRGLVLQGLDVWWLWLVWLDVGGIAWVGWLCWLVLCCWLGEVGWLVGVLVY